VIAKGFREGKGKLFKIGGRGKIDPGEAGEARSQRK